MGRKAKTTFSARKGGNKSPHPRVLVVCEGEKTEPYYFEGLRNHLRLRSANIEIVGEGATPTRIVRRAEERHQEERAVGNPFDEIFCVFDKEEHADYNRAVRILEQKSSTRENDTRWRAAVASVPAFEYWLLLHYKYTDRPYQKTGSKSAGEMVADDLKKHFKGYRKNDEGIFGHFRNQLEQAKENAARSLAATQKAGTDNPSTRVHELVDFLQKIKDS